MKYHCLLLPLFLFSYHRVHSQKHYDACYTYGLNLFVFSQADKHEDTLDVIGADPDLSPDGTRVAYTAYEHNGDIRKIQLVNLTSGATTVLDPACKHCYGPVWSPDGKQIVYNAMTGSTWHILLRNLSGTEAPVDLTNGLQVTGDVFSPTWSQDGKKILLQDLASVYVLDLTGRIMDTIPISRLREAPSITSATRYLLSKDETSIYFDMEIDPSSGADDPPAAIFAYDRKTKKTRQVSPNGYDCFRPVLKGNRIFFCGYKEGDTTVDKRTFVGNIYSSALDGSDFRLEFKNRRDISFKR
jgi:Tol biopolymer transport system component